MAQYNEPAKKQKSQSNQVTKYKKMVRPVRSYGTELKNNQNEEQKE